MLDFRVFLRRHGIEFTTNTANTSRGHVNINCPFCRGSDPSDHCGINLKTGAWNCWRADHPGISRSPARLVQELLRCSWEEAKRIVYGDRPEIPDDKDLFAEARLKLGLEPEPPKKTALTWPSEIKPLLNGSPFAIAFLEYLKSRDYSRAQVEWLIKTFDLRYALKGRFSYRVVIPFYDRRGQLLTWQGRSILKDPERRYLALRNEEQICAPKETLFGLNYLSTVPNPKALLVCEGAFDAMRIITFGREFGIYATALSGLSLLPPQMVLLEELRKQFAYMALLLDATASFQAFQLATLGFDLRVLQLDPQYKDPGSMPTQAVFDLLMSVLPSLKG